MASQGETYSGEEAEKIGLWFVPERTPEGAAPKEVRDKWVGVPLPVRQSEIINEAGAIQGFKVGANIFNPTDVRVMDLIEVVTVRGLDAMKALRLAGREEAALWWEDYFENRDVMFGVDLIFHASEGRLLTPAEIEVENPPLASFDQLGE